MPTVSTLSIVSISDTTPHFAACTPLKTLNPQTGWFSEMGVVTRKPEPPPSGYIPTPAPRARDRGDTRGHQRRNDVSCTMLFAWVTPYPWREDQDRRFDTDAGRK